MLPAGTGLFAPFTLNDTMWVSWSELMVVFVAVGMAHVLSGVDADDPPLPLDITGIPSFHDLDSFSPS